MVIKEDFSRRKFIRYSVIGGAVVPLLSGVPYENEVYGGVFNAPKDLENLTEIERIHLPKVIMPPVVEDGTQASNIKFCRSCGYQGKILHDSCKRRSVYQHTNTSCWG